MQKLSTDARVLGLHLGLGDLQHGPPCHGYQNCCTCPDCLDRERTPAQATEMPRQPWEPKAA